MNKERFVEITIEEGYTEREANFLWDGKPNGHNPSEEAIREISKAMLPLFIAQRRD